MTDLNDGMDRTTGEQLGPANVGVLAARINEDHDAVSDLTASLAALIASLNLLPGNPPPVGNPPPGDLSTFESDVLGLPGLRRDMLFDEASGLVLIGHATELNGSYSATGVTYGVTDTVATAPGTPAVPNKGVTLADGVGVATIPHDGTFDLSLKSTSSWSIFRVAGDIADRVDDLKYPHIFVKGNAVVDGLDFFYDPHYQSLGLKAQGTEGGSPTQRAVSLSLDLDPGDFPTPQSLSTQHFVGVTWDGPTLTLTFWLDGKVAEAFVIGSGEQKTITTTSDFKVGGTASTDAAQFVSKLIVATENLGDHFAGLYTDLHGPDVTPPGNGAVLLWADEFDGPAGAPVSPSEWFNIVGPAAAPGDNLHRVGYMPGGTNNIALDGNSHCVITMRRENSNGYGFTSGRLEHKHPWLTGYLEVKASVPVWPGAAPGIWTFGAASSSYPSASLYSGSNDFIEIDMLEIKTNVDPNHVRMNIHGDYSDHTDSHLWDPGWGINMADISAARTAMHVYGCYVNPANGSVTFWVDGVQKKQVLQGSQPSGGIWPYGYKYMISVLEIEVGGYSGYPDGSKNSDTMVVDYIRLYDKPPF